MTGVATGGHCRATAVVTLTCRTNSSNRHLEDTFKQFVHFQGIAGATRRLPQPWASWKRSHCVYARCNGPMSMLQAR